MYAFLQRTIIAMVNSVISARFMLIICFICTVTMRYHDADKREILVSHKLSISIMCY
jgi:hypothetical protein